MFLANFTALAAGDADTEVAVRTADSLSLQNPLQYCKTFRTLPQKRLNGDAEKSAMQLKEPPINRATIEAVAQLIAERFDPVQVILFGSHARGNAGSHSDIDLLVVLESMDDWPKEGNPIRRAIGEDFILPVDVLVTTPERLAQQRDDPYSFFNTALESKVILHARPAPPRLKTGSRRLNRTWKWPTEPWTVELLYLRWPAITASNAQKST